MVSLREERIMPKIEKLTKLQEKQLIEHREEYIKWGLCCDPINKDLATKSIGEMYKRINKKEPYFWVCDSPVQIQLVICVLKSLKIKQGANLGANLRNDLGDNLWDSDFWGQMDLVWISFYKFPEKFLKIDYKEMSEILDLWDKIGKSCSWWYPYENICFISDRPKEIHKKGIKLHKDGGPALSFRDGYSLYFLNGIDMGKKYVMTPAEKIEGLDILKEKNVDKRRELIRKVGIEKMLDILPHKIHDTKGDYQLIGIDLSEELKDRRYLKMKNPSIGIWHLEGVEQDCNTVQEAINWRRFGNKELNWNPEVLS